MWDRHRTATAGPPQTPPPPPPPLLLSRRHYYSQTSDQKQKQKQQQLEKHLAGDDCLVALAEEARIPNPHSNNDTADTDSDLDFDSHFSTNTSHHHHHNHHNYDYEYVCQPDLDSSLHNALGIRNVTLKYRIHKGKAVRQTLYQNLPRLSLRDPLSPSAPIREPPPRNPRRLQQSQYKTVLPPRPPSSLYNQDQNSPDTTDYDSEHSDDDAFRPRTTTSLSAACSKMLPPTLELVSPPSSPDNTASRNNSLREDNVSPLDSDVSLEEFVRKVKGPSRNRPLTSPTQLGSTPGQLPSQLRDHPLPQLPRETTLDDAPTEDVRLTLPSQQQQYPEPQQKRPAEADISRWQRPATNQNKRTSAGPMQSLAPNSTAGPYQNDDPSRPTLGQRFRQAAARPKAQAIENRPPWQGATGRESVVKPMHDDLTVSPLNIPSRIKRASGKGEGSLRNRLSHIGHSRDGSSGPPSSMRKFLSSRAHKKATSMAISSPMDPGHWDSGTTGADSYPSPPSESSMKRFSQMPLQQAPHTSPSQQSPGNQIKRKPPPPTRVDGNMPHAHPLASSPVDPDELPTRGSPTPQPLPSPPAEPTEKDNNWEQPPSRFSTTTYATTAANTPRPDTGSDAPSPLLPTIGSSTPVMQRGRPLPKADNIRTASNSSASSSPLQSPKADSARPQTSNAVNSPRPPSAMSSISKPLPPAPPEVSASDRIAHLTAQLQGLANRRININRCVKQMTELMPTDSVMASLDVRQRREDEKKKVDSLREELAEVQREEYELGLMLHRAYKRQDREAKYEPTTLWVRRVAA